MFLSHVSLIFPEKHCGREFRVSQQYWKREVVDNLGNLFMGNQISETKIGQMERFHMGEHLQFILNNNSQL